MEPLKCENCGRTDFRAYSSNVNGDGLTTWIMCQTPFQNIRLELPASYDSALCMRYIGLVIPWGYMRLWERSEE